MVAFHVHTNRSFDSMVTPRRLIRRCEALGVRTVCVTDHDTIDGGLAVRSEARGSPLQVIVGAEYHTHLGDVIGLFLNDEIRERDAFEVVDAIHAQGGIAVLPHPFHAHPDVEELHRAVDAIEVFNGRCSRAQNEGALALALRLEKPMVVGSDAHFLCEISNALTWFDGDLEVEPADLLLRPREWSGRNASATLVRASQGVKGLKTRSSRLTTYAVLATLKHAVREVSVKQFNYAVVGRWPTSDAGGGL